MPTLDIVYGESRITQDYVTPRVAMGARVLGKGSKGLDLRKT